MRTTLNVLTRALEYLVGALLAMMAAALLLEVLLRFVFETSLPWTSEFARYAMIWITFVGAALAIKERSHIQINFFVRLLPRNLERYAYIAVNLILIAFVAVLLKNSIITVQTEMKVYTAAMNIPFGYIVLSLPLAGVFMIIYLLMDIKALLNNEQVETPDEVSQC